MGASAQWSSSRLELESVDHLMAGRIPTPTALKIMQGNPGKRALPKDEPKPTEIEPTRPGKLSERAHAEWDRLAPILQRMRVLTEADGAALGMLCADIAELEEITAEIEKTGKVIKNKRSGAIRLNPLIALQSQLNQRVTTGLREFGLSPASRTKVRTAKADGPAQMFNLKRNATSEAG